jgi:hypothetical protein
MTASARTPKTVDAGSLWAGGAAAALVAALVVVVGILLCRGVLDIPVLAPEGEGVWGNANTVTFAVGAAVAAFVATGVLHLLLLSAPQPTKFFGWIMVLATAIGVLAPFTTDAETDSKIATAAVLFAVGVAIGSLVSASGRSAVRKAMLRSGPPPLSPPYRGR